jgi:subtilase family serine protease
MLWGNLRAIRPIEGPDCNQFMCRFLLQPFRQATFGLLLIPFAIGAAPLRTLDGHVPALTAYARRLADAPPTQELDLALGLPLRNRDKLAQLLAQLYDVRGAQYRHFVSAEEFADKFGPSEEDYATVRRFAEEHGFQVLKTHSNRALLDVKASVRDIEQAFHLRMGLYEHPTENRAFYAPDMEPSVEADVPLLSISGLDNAVLPQPASLRERPQGSPTPEVGSGPAGYYWGYDFRHAYVPGVSLTGTGQAVGLFELASYFTNDIGTYETKTGLPSVPVTNVLVDDYTNDPGNGTLEVSLDIELAIAMAPGLSEVLVYEGSIPNDVLNQMATDNLAKQLSSSWEFTGVNANTEQIYEQFAAQGQSMFQASGDNGAYTNSPLSPTDDPWVTCVGGTTLTTGASASWEGERVWNWNTEHLGNRASGGGVSTTWAIPIWQQGIDMSLNQGSTAWRNIPDVAMVADMIWLIASNGNQYPIGGTSAAAPLWAGFMALANEQAAASGHPPVGFANPTLYELARGPEHGALFHDVTIGNNTNLSVDYEFFAQPGYDLCTGWGTPNGSNLLNALAQNQYPAVPLLNGGFEEGSFTNWTVDATGLVAVVSTNTIQYVPYVHSGTYAAYLIQPVQLGYLSQSAVTLPGQPCLISFWLDNPVGGTPSEFQVFWNGSKIFDQTNLPVFGWTNIQLVAAAVSSNTVLKFGFRQDVDAFGLDDVGVMVVPAPSFQSISTVSNSFNLAWNAWAGLNYQIQYTIDPGAPVWQNLGLPITATNSVMSFTDLLPADRWRFYRIALLP